MNLYRLNADLEGRNIAKITDIPDDNDEMDMNEIEEERKWIPLDQINAHGRDMAIVKNEEKHVYYVNGTAMKCSATGFKSFFFPPFDDDGLIRMMFRNSKTDGKYYKSKYGNSNYENMTHSDILKYWSSTSGEGTRFHLMMEYLLNIHQDMLSKFNANEIAEECVKIANSKGIMPDMKRIKLISQFLVTFFKKGWKPYRVEWKIYDEEYGIAGTIDAVFSKTIKDKTEFMIIDWKTVVATTNKDSSSYKCYHPFENMKASKMNEYLIQLNLYAHILKTRYDINVKNLMAIMISPQNIKDYVLDVIDMVPALKIYKNNINFYDDIIKWKTLDPGSQTSYPFLPEPFFSKENDQESKNINLSNI